MTGVQGPAATGRQIAGVHGSQPHPATCDELATRDANRTSWSSAAKVGAWDAADASLKSFAHMAVAAQVGCSWCLDVGYFQAHGVGTQT